MSADKNHFCTKLIWSAGAPNHWCDENLSNHREITFLHIYFVHTHSVKFDAENHVHLKSKEKHVFLPFFCI